MTQRPVRDRSSQRDRRDHSSPIRDAPIDSHYRERSRERMGTQTKYNKIPNERVNTPYGKKQEEEERERGRSLERKAADHENASNEAEDNDEMMKLMGFGSFETTKNKHVQGIGKGAVKKNKKTQFRQYMNREKGFNRALSPERSKK
ncbi:hypothetical protein WICMUC_002246 [Wickerhamomyces mucosus]|uniref:U4/U6.U5 small nuclear ribonucleoprotein 27kDa protein domain-containing protein n=1 Tax=Wickerhamomyces mucosus TaxID=1378264 RepID=A0A9P8TET1_9ASCO|nr:hypothetical protein WICMUC_002246 [Wickerhamomyces mucosus]